MTKKIMTRPDEFRRFHKALTADIKWKPWYFKLNRADKDPLQGISWKDLKAKRTPKRALRWMEAGFNIGIAATNMDPLVIVDIDDIAKTPDSEVQPTLTVMSRKRRGRHYYYLTEDPKCKVNIPTGDYGEMRANWQYTVAPGSYVETHQGLIDLIPEDDKVNAGYYTIEKMLKPTYIKYNNIPDIFKHAQLEEKEDQLQKKVTKKADTGQSALYTLTVDDLFNLQDKVTRFPSIFHASETGTNTAIIGDWLQCWRHNVSHNALSAIAVMGGITDCLNGGWGHTDSSVGPSVLDFKDGETKYKIWKYAKEQKFIPEDDKIPYVAREYLEGLFR